MNRIILIGNGFDLAHRMKTSYNDFINDYWENTIKDIQKNNPRNGFENDEISIGPSTINWQTGETFKMLIDTINQARTQLVFKNEFLEVISFKKQEQNWVDIENEYYELLKKSFKDPTCTYGIERLNSDFNKIQKLLEIYLTKVEEKFLQGFEWEMNSTKIKTSIGFKIYSDFKLKDFSESTINKKVEAELSRITINVKNLDRGFIDTNELSNEDERLLIKLNREVKKESVRKLLISGDAADYFDLVPNEILFLNFNYTFTEYIYYDHNKFRSFQKPNELEKKHIHIHGTTDPDDDNDVIFGFGDEIDKNYKAIENLNKNVYLENIKSIKYLETDNYKRLLEFLNYEDYQIFIFGHSCGISDRTLLNTLFEHKNCVSIKPYYHKKEDGSDNYSDIIRNISRNFNSKSNMRDKVVNKKYCEPLLPPIF